MNAISKVSEITTDDLVEYLNLTASEITTGDKTALSNLLGIAKSYIRQYTGRSETDIDNYQDLVIVALALVQDMWDNRILYVDETNLNRVVESILDMHSTNLLPVEE